MGQEEKGEREYGRKRGWRRKDVGWVRRRRIQRERRVVQKREERTEGV
jgi:hypothetical protein